MTKRNFILLIFVLILTTHFPKMNFGQSRTVGLFLNDTSKVFKGYTLFSPKHYPYTYLIDNEGRIINQWTKSIYEPGQSVYLLENGNLMRTCMVKGQMNTGGGEGGRIEEYDWNGNLVWELDFSTSTYMQHHDIRPLPNGNIIMLVVEKKTYAEVLQAGFNPTKLAAEIQQKNIMVPDYVVEIKPTKPKGGTVVWEWHVWDHLIQDYDKTKDNYGVVKDHPELIDAAGDQKNIPAFWNHMNSIDYNPALDQIAMSVRGNSEVWIIDHSTTTAEAKGHTGGKYGKGGDLLYRYGNPIAYRTGTAADQKFYQQHDAEWVRPDCPGAGNITVFNNGLSRNYSTIDEITPPINSDRTYSLTSGKPFGPSAFTWTWKATPPTSMYAEAISGAQRLQNGNTIICDGTHGTFLEVTQAGDLVWKYICPAEKTGPLFYNGTISDDPARAGEKMNAVFRVYKYPLDYPAFKGKTLTPGDFIEKYSTTSVDDAINNGFKFKIYPNILNTSTTISVSLKNPENVSLKVYNLSGFLVKELNNEFHPSGTFTVNWDGSDTSGIKLSPGVYLCQLKTLKHSSTQRIVIL
jgi:hypothetical protein